MGALAVGRMTEKVLHRKLVWWWVLVGSLSVLIFIGQETSDEPPPDTLYQYTTALLNIPYYLLLLGLVLLIAVGLDRREAFALKRPESWRRAGLLALGVFVAMWITAAALEQFLRAGEEQGLDPRQITSGDVPPFLLSALVIAVLGPIVEELTFRGLGFYLLSQFGDLAAIVVTSFAFALAHGIVAGIPVFFVIGAALAFVRSRTGSIYPAMLMHGSFNAIQLIGGAAT
jgi:membrane protease YdiL (CAAX protease family)